MIPLLQAPASEPEVNEALEVRTATRDGYTEHYLTGTVSAGPDWAASTAELFDRVARALAAGGVHPMRETLYGLASARNEVLALRRAALEAQGLSPDLPVTYLEGAPCHEGPFAGLQLWGASIPDAARARVETVHLPGGVTARSLHAPGFRLVLFPGLSGVSADLGASGGERVAAPEQASRMLARCSAALDAVGLSFLQVERTWIYMARILDWYGEFNRVRTEHFRKAGLQAGGRRSAFPASTGIQARHEEEECLMDVLAVDVSEPGSLRVKPILSTPRQGPASAYGSAFSRAVALESAQGTTIHVSGTASIDGVGRTVHLNDPEGQCLATLLNVAALLEEQGAGLRDISSATVFCKDRAACEAFRTVVRLLGVPRFPAVFVLADVCRSDLVVEVEAVALA